MLPSLFLCRSGSRQGQWYSHTPLWLYTACSVSCVSSQFGWCAALEPRASAQLLFTSYLFSAPNSAGRRWAQRAQAHGAPARVYADQLELRDPLHVYCTAEGSAAVPSHSAPGSTCVSVNLTFRTHIFFKLLHLPISCHHVQIWVQKLANTIVWSVTLVRSSLMHGSCPHGQGGL